MMDTKAPVSFQIGTLPTLDKLAVFGIVNEKILLGFDLIQQGQVGVFDQVVGPEDMFPLLNESYRQDNDDQAGTYKKQEPEQKPLAKGQKHAGGC
jgi:hypothetical protein